MDRDDRFSKLYQPHYEAVLRYALPGQLTATGRPPGPVWKRCSSWPVPFVVVTATRDDGGPVKYMLMTWADDSAEVPAE
jgi:hypothetical protein